jgi:hypothetical protein
MSFLRHGESINPMRLVPLGASGLAHSQCPSASMSSSRLFLGRLLSSRACLRFADHERFSKTQSRRTMNFQPTATTPLSPCLSPRVHSTNAVPSPAPHPGWNRKTGQASLLIQVGPNVSIKVGPNQVVKRRAQPVDAVPPRKRNGDRWRHDRNCREVAPSRHGAPFPL